MFIRAVKGTLLIIYALLQKISVTNLVYGFSRPD